MSVYPARTPSTLNTSPLTAETMIEAAARVGADRVVMAAGPGDLPLGQAGGASPGELGGAAGPASATRAVGTAEQDPPGSGPGQRPGGGGATAMVREGDEELLGRAVPLLHVVRYSSNEQRPGTPIRLATLPRATCQRTETGDAGLGGAGFRARGGEPGRATTTGGRAEVADRICGGLAAAACPIGQAPGNASQAATIPS